MKLLYDELARRFPEILSRIFPGDEELSYMLMVHLAEWLKGLSTDELNQQLVDKIVSFVNWCEEQPRGKDASEDMLTILVVGFFESLFDSDVTRPLIPKLISRDDFIANADYLRLWIGNENYEITSKYYPDKSRRSHRSAKRAWKSPKFERNTV